MSNARDKYGDIIDLEHFVSKNRKHMSRLDRAAQFAPFAALTGYEESIDEAARITDDKLELSETTLAILDKKVAILKEHIKEHNKITITYFEEDKYKNGGEYISKEIVLKNIDEVYKLLIDENNQSYPIDYMIDIDSELFDGYL